MPGKILPIAAVALCIMSCQSMKVDSPAFIERVEPAQFPPDVEQTITIFGESFFPTVRRNIGCGAQAFSVDYQVNVHIQYAGPLGETEGGEWNSLEDAQLGDAFDSVAATIPQTLAHRLLPGIYNLALETPDSTSLLKKNAFKITNDLDTGTDNDSDTDTDTETETEFIWPLPYRIQAECAFGANTGDCNGLIDGFNSDTIIDPANNIIAPQLSMADTHVGYMDGGIWLAYPDIDFTGYDAILMNLGSLQNAGTFELRLDAPDGISIATINIPDTGGWNTMVEQTFDIIATDGIHTLYIVGGGEAGVGNGNIDWFEFHSSQYVNADALVHYDFQEGTGTVVHDISGNTPPLDLSISNGSFTTWTPDGLQIYGDTPAIRSSGDTTALISALRNSRQLSIYADVTPGAPGNPRTSRIVSFSDGPTGDDVYVMLGQRFTTLVVWLNAAPAIGYTETIIPDALADGIRVRILVTYDGLNVNIFVNGILAVNPTPADGDFSHWIDHPLLLANETTNDLPWIGTYHEVAIYAVALLP